MFATRVKWRFADVLLGPIRSHRYWKPAWTVLALHQPVTTLILTLRELTFYRFIWCCLLKIGKFYKTRQSHTILVFITNANTKDNKRDRRI